MNQEISEKHAITMLECMRYIADNRLYDALMIPEPEEAVYAAALQFSENMFNAWKEQRNRVAELKHVV